MKKMKKIGLMDIDGHNFPNLALMKLSAFHKQKGDSVEFTTIGNYDKTYVSKVFTFTPDFTNGFGNYGEVIVGGSGFKKAKATHFKKGNEPHNTKFDGHERITKDGYIEIRISIANYRLKHIVEWEKINGKIPKSYCLKCKTKNKTNTDVKNWDLISRAENMYNNSNHNYPKEIIPSLVLVNKLNKKLKILQDG